SAQAIAARVINDPPRPIRTVRPALPVPLERAIAAGLAKSPADRPRTARAFVGALARPARERRVSARQVAWMATASGVAIIGWIVWRGWRIHTPPGEVLVPPAARRASCIPGATAGSLAGPTPIRCATASRRPPRAASDDRGSVRWT